MPFNSPFLFPSLKNQKGVLALRPLLIAGMAEPIEGGDGGINIAVVTEHSEGMLCLINPYLGMQAGDRHVIYWELQAIFTREVKPEEVDKPLMFFLPVTNVTSGWVEQCHYELTRAGATVPDDPSVPLRLLVKLFPPGGRDKEPHLPGHSELKIAQLPPELVQQGIIDAEQAAKGVPVTIPFYPDIRVYDKILLRWGSHTLPAFLVTQQQADKTQPIIITVDQDAILAGGDALKLPIKYDLNDETGNWSVNHSQTTYINVDAGAWRLDAPVIKEAVNGVINVKDLNKQPVTVLIRVEGPDFAVGDTLTMKWIGTPFTGPPLVHSESQTIDAVPGEVAFKVPYKEVQAIAMGSADASYVLFKSDGSATLSSKRTFADVAGAVTMLAEPSIRELVGDVLEPDTPTATVDIRYTSMKNGDLVNLIWLGTKADGTPYVHEQQHTVTRNEAEARHITLFIEHKHIIVLDNGHLDLSYRVSNDDAALYGVSESERLLAKVQTIVATLPAPKVPEANNGVLDPADVVDKVTVLVDFPGTDKGDVLTYYWFGPVASTSDWVPITSLLIGKPVRFRVDAAYVHDNVGQNVQVRYALWRKAPQQYEYSAPLDVMIGQLLGELPAPVVIQAPSETLNPMDGLKGVDVRVSYSSMTPGKDNIRLKWLGTPGAGTSEDQELPAEPDGSVEFALPSSLVGANVNSKVLVFYEVQRNSQTTPSKILELLVSNFQDPEKELPRPHIPQATSADLDLTTFDGDATVRVATWPFIALKQHLWLRLEGETDGGVPYRITLIDGVEITAAQVINGLSEVLLRSELLKLGHGTSVMVICKVAFDGGTVESAAISFPALRLDVKTHFDYLTPVITEISDSQGPIAEEGSTYDTQVTIKGTGTRGERVALFDGTSPLEEKDVADNGTWSYLLSGLKVKNYRITAKALYGDKPVSLPRTFTVEMWVDSVTDFNNGTAGNWVKGPAGYQGVVKSGVFYNNTPGPQGHAGLLFSQSFRLITGKTYSFSYRARNFSPLPINVPPIFSVQLDSGQQILAPYSVPRTGQWYTQTANFTVTQSANRIIQMMSHQDRGGGGDADGGNDYEIDDIVVRVVT